MTNRVLTVLVALPDRNGPENLMKATWHFSPWLQKTGTLISSALPWLRCRQEPPESVEGNTDSNLPFCKWRNTELSTSKSNVLRHPTENHILGEFIDGGFHIIIIKCG